LWSENMKRVLLTALAAGLMTCGAAQATTYAGTYKILSDAANNSPLHNSNPAVSIANWLNTTLTVNATGNSYLSGVVRGSNGLHYNINLTLTDTYARGANQAWGNFAGTLSGNGLNLSLNDIDPGRDGNDALIGINATPYNNANPGGNTNVLEFGFWGDNSPRAGGTRNSDVNVHVSCTSGSGVGGPANTNGTCSTGGNVPLPGTLALLGIAALGLGLRAKKRA
jgi:PEP-CTERM motif